MATKTKPQTNGRLNASEQRDRLVALWREHETKFHISFDFDPTALTKARAKQLWAGYALMRSALMTKAELRKFKEELGRKAEAPR